MQSILIELYLPPYSCKKKFNVSAAKKKYLNLDMIFIAI